MATVVERALGQVDTCHRKLLKMATEFNLKIVALRKICPHMLVAEAMNSFDGRLVRVCQHCGIQELAWKGSFTTLTHLGDFVFNHRRDNTALKRGGRIPMVTHRNLEEVYAYRRGQHEDVSAY